MRRTADRSDLTLQGGPNQHGTYLPRRTIHANHSPHRLELQDRPTIIWSAELNVRPPKVNICIPISPRLLDYPRRWDGVMYFRGEAALGLLVSTTSYSRHAASTIQSPISTADNGRSLIDIDEAKTPRNPVLLPYLYIVIISPSGLTLSIYLKSYSIYMYWNGHRSYTSRVTGNYSTSNHLISREWQ